MKKNLLTILALILTVTIGSQIANALGTLTPSGTPGDDTQYTLNDIYDKLVNFADTPTATSSPFAVPGSVSPSFRTLTEIYALLNAENSDLVASNIATGTTIFGVTGNLATSTDLEWSEVNSTGNFSAVNSYCATLNEGGTGWRLPTYIELAKGLTEQFLFSAQYGFESETYYWTSDVESPGISIYGIRWQDQLFGASLDITEQDYYVKCVR